MHMPEGESAATHVAAVDAVTSVREATSPAISPLQDPQQAYNYYKQIFQGRSLPLAYIDLDLLDQNIRQIAARSGGKRIRLASKSLRSVAILRRILAADSCFQGIMCFTVAEAVYLAEQGFADLLIGYPAWREQDMESVAHAVAT